MKRAALQLLAFVAGTVVAAAHPIVATYERFYSTEPTAGGGLLLLNELNCVSCHAVPDTWRDRLPGRGKIDLAGVGARWHGEGLGKFIADPHAFKPGTAMPKLASTTQQNAALLAYLASLATGTEPRRAKPFPAGDARRGQRLFDTVGCAACHAPANGSATVPLVLAKHYDRTALAAFIQDPLHTRPGGRMPSTELKDAEAADIAAHLQAGIEPAPVLPAAAPALVAQGREHFVARNCTACHTTNDASTPKAAKPLAALTSDLGCLASKPAAGVPDFSLNDGQRRALAAAVRTVQAGPAPKLTADQRVAAKLEQLNCYACHEWRGRGGAGERAKLFTAEASAIDSLGELGYLPPKLDTAGRKLTPEWLAKLLWGSEGGVRPYLRTRMPRYGEAAAGDLVPLLAEACRPAEPKEIDTSGSVGHQRFFTGRTLLGVNTGGLGCVSCHGVKSAEPTGVRTINLTHTAKRLNPEYFMALLLDPQATQPGTIMPPLLAGKKDAYKNVESIWTYFKELDQSDVIPEGLGGGGTFELKPRDEGRPIVFRTFLEGAGTQAIAVGFPAGVHVAFDAYEVRWALAWSGRFLDAMTNWEERPMKPIKPLGDKPRLLPNHVAFA
ncbi:MAG TPA: cytochrome c, partial [Opitutaceae bacterium]